MIRLGFCSPCGCAFPAPAPRATLHDQRMMCQATPVFFVPELSVLEQAQAFHFRHKKRLTFVRRIMLFYVIRLGFEPKTHSLEGCCSIQLSYRTGLYIAPKGKAATKIVLFILLTSKNQTVNLREA